MIRASLVIAAAAGAAALVLAPAVPMAQQAQPKTVAAAPVKAGAGQKVCRYRFPSGQSKTWVCKKDEPCCAWDLFNYVKCGSKATGCL